MAQRPAFLKKSTNLDLDSLAASLLTDTMSTPTKPTVSTNTASTTTQSTSTTPSHTKQPQQPSTQPHQSTKQPTTTPKPTPHQKPQKSHDPPHPKHQKPDTTPPSDQPHQTAPKHPKGAHNGNNEKPAPFTKHSKYDKTPKDTATSAPADSTTSTTSTSSTSTPAVPAVTQNDKGITLTPVTPVTKPVKGPGPKAQGKFDKAEKFTKPEKHDKPAIKPIEMVEKFDKVEPATEKPSKPLPPHKKEPKGKYEKASADPTPQQPQSPPQQHHTIKIEAATTTTPVSTQPASPSQSTSSDAPTPQLTRAQKIALAKQQRAQAPEGKAAPQKPEKGPKGTVAVAAETTKATTAGSASATAATLPDHHPSHQKASSPSQAPPINQQPHQPQHQHQNPRATKATTSPPQTQAQPQSQPQPPAPQPTGPVRAKVELIAPAPEPVQPVKPSDKPEKHDKLAKPEKHSHTASTNSTTSTTTSAKPEPTENPEKPTKSTAFSTKSTTAASTSTTPAAKPTTTTATAKPTTTSTTAAAKPAATPFKLTPPQTMFHPLVIKDTQIAPFSKLPTPPQSFSELYVAGALHPCIAPQIVPPRLDFRKLQKKIEFTPDMLAVLPIELQQRITQWSEWLTVLEGRIANLKPKFWSDLCRDWPTANETSKIKKQIHSMLKTMAWILNQQLALVKAIQSFQRSIGSIMNTIDQLEVNFNSLTRNNSNTSTTASSTTASTTSTKSTPSSTSTTSTSASKPTDSDDNHSLIRKHLLQHCQNLHLFHWPALVFKNVTGGSLQQQQTIPYSKVAQEYLFHNHTGPHFEFVQKHVQVNISLFKSYCSSKAFSTKFEQLLVDQRALSNVSTSSTPSTTATASTSTTSHSSTQTSATAHQDSKAQSSNSTSLEALLSGIDLSTTKAQTNSTAAIDPRYFGHSTPLKLALTGLPYFMTIPMLRDLFAHTKPTFPQAIVQEEEELDENGNHKITTTSPFHPDQPIPSTTSVQYDRCWLKKGSKSDLGAAPSTASGMTSGGSAGSDKSSEHKKKNKNGDDKQNQSQSTIHVGSFGPEFSTAFVTFTTYNEFLVFKTTFIEFEYVGAVPGSMQMAKYLLNVSIPLNTYVPLLPFDGDDDDTASSTVPTVAASTAPQSKFNDYSKKGKKGAATTTTTTPAVPVNSPEEDHLLSQSKWLTTAHFKDFLTELVKEVKNSQPTSTSSVFGAAKHSHQLVGSAALVQQLETERQAQLQAYNIEYKKLEQYFKTPQGRRNLHLKADKERELLLKHNRTHDPLTGLSAAFGQGLGAGRTADVSQIQLPIIDQLVKQTQQATKKAF